MELGPTELEVGRRKITQVFRYLEALNQLRNPVKRLLEDQPWVLWFRDLPEHVAVQRGQVEEANDDKASGQGGSGMESAADQSFVLKVSRPKLTHAPAPPDQIAQWIQPGWERVDGHVETYPTRNVVRDDGETEIAHFEDDPGRVELLSGWKERRDAWVINEMPARAAAGLFERLYELHGQIEREGERVELVFGDGILSWRRADGGVYHPVLLQRVQLEFQPERPEFTIRETEHAPELYSALFRDMADVDGRLIGRCREELEQGAFHPLDSEPTSGFMRRLVAILGAQGEFVDGGAPRGMTEQPRLGRDPVIFVRARTLGFATAIEAILEDIQSREHLPNSLVNIVGIETREEGPAVNGEEAASKKATGTEEVLLSKAANHEQVQIAQRLAKYGSVLVQGPPGTGKTHTIANLIGHLLAHGKSVLVTSHTTKALRVLRDHVVPELRPLCVSVLESDLDSRRLNRPGFPGDLFS